MLYYLSLLCFAGNASTESKCDCPAACNVTTYNADLSYAALSVDGINSLLSDDHDEIQKKHVAAEEIQERLESSSFIDTLQKLNHIDTTVTQFDQFWTSTIKRIETSSIYRVDKALTSAVEMANRDVSSLFVNVTAYNIYYRENLALEREVLDDMFQRAGSLFADAIHPLIIPWNDTPDKNITATSLKLFEELIVLLENAFSLCAYYDEIIIPTRRNDMFCPTSPVSSYFMFECIALTIGRYLLSFYEINARMSNDTTNYVSYADFFEDTYFMDPFITDMKPSDLLLAWKDHQKSLSHCVNEYGVYLSHVQDWLHLLTYTSR